MLRAVIFDFDGVIADTEPLHLRAFQGLLADYRIDLSEDDYYARYVGLDDWGLARTLAEDWPQLPRDGSRLQALVFEKWERYEKLMAASPVLFDGVGDLLREWSRHVPLAIASGARRPEIDTILGSTNLLSCFTSIVTAEEVQRGKPAPDIYLLALERINQAESERRDGDGHRGDARVRLPLAEDCRQGLRIEPSEVVAIEDSQWGLDAARAAGMRTVAVAARGRADPSRLKADLVVERTTCLDLPTLTTLTTA